MKNELSEARSLYLRQHADQPVHWRSWGEAAFAAAAAENKPMLVSIGYSACHWCHVMAREAFSDPLCADLMNRHFICVKVDREERPDLDQTYMEAIQMLEQPAGWPLNAFCLPDGRPFYGGTYFPARDDGSGIVPWPQVLMRVADFYKRQRSELAENAHAIQQNMLAANQPDSGERPWLAEQLLTAARGILGNNDPRYGGFGKAPKFPNAPAIRFLLGLRQSMAVRNDPSLARMIDDAVRLHLRAMAHGGIFDQIGGGFARYSTDDFWLVPHFEKMLYDNALLISAYSRGARHFKESLFLKVAEETAAWVVREMAVDGGGFAASLGAETAEGEGRYYLWTREEIAETLGSERASHFAQVYNITEAGNFRDGRSNPALTEADPAVRDALAEDRVALLRTRASRARPERDAKRVTAWNALVAQAFAELWLATGHTSYLQTARRTLDFLWNDLSNSDFREFRIASVAYSDGGNTGDGFLPDYAHFGDACLSAATALELAGEPEPAAELRARANACGQALLNRFSDSEPGFFFTASDYPTVLARRKDWLDSGVPAGNSAALHLMVGLAAIDETGAFAARIEQTLPAYLPFTERVALGVAEALGAATDRASGAPLVRHGVGADLNSLHKQLAGKPFRRFHLLPADSKHPVPARSFSVCVGERCLPLIEDAGEVAELIA